MLQTVLGWGEAAGSPWHSDLAGGPHLPLVHLQLPLRALLPPRLAVGMQGWAPSAAPPPPLSQGPRV